MALFQIFIPAADRDGLNITARIRADTWLQALRNGLSRLGNTADVKNILADITEEGIKVTEPGSGRVFHIRELEAEDEGPLTPDAPPAAADPSSLAIVTEGSAAAPEEELFSRGRTTLERSAEDILGDLFDQTDGLYDRQRLEEAASFLLDLAMQSVPSDSGSVFVVDINTADLYFVAARGPKADEVMTFRVPLGQGIVGFSALEGVSLAVSDVQRHPLFYAKISKQIGYETHSILCSPACLGGRVYGAIELINKSDGTGYTNDEVNILSFLAHELADYMVTTGQTGG